MCKYIYNIGYEEKLDLFFKYKILDYVKWLLQTHHW
jgi:hypothetical protein